MTRIPKPGPRWRPGCRCHYCGRELSGPGGNKPRSFTRDHVVPRSAGGSDTPDNIVAACLRCNQAKASMGMEQWRAVFAERRFGIPYFSADQRRWLTEQGFRFPDAPTPFFWFEERMLEELLS